MQRRGFLKLIAASGIGAVTVPASAESKSPDLPSESHRVRSFDLDELTVAELQTGMAAGRYSAVSLAKKYLKRIQEIDRGDPRLRSVIEVNPDAIPLAAALDKERKAKG